MRRPLELSNAESAMAVGTPAPLFAPKVKVLGVPIVCSRTSPTALAVRLAEHLNVTVVGYIRNDTMNVYSHPRRLGG